MKKIFSLISVWCFNCCTSNVNIEVAPKVSNLIPVSPNNKVAEVLCKEEPLVKTLISNQKIALEGCDLIGEPDIKYTSGYTDNFSFTQYQLSYKENTFEFDDTVFEKSKVNKRNTYLNKKLLNVCNIKNNTFDLDLMEVHIVYSESEIYAFKNNPFYLLVISHPMNWVGTMSRFSFFQLINLKEKTVVEFIREEE